MKKRTLALLLVCVMLAAAFAGCTNAADDGPGDTGTEPTPANDGGDAGAEMINIGGEGNFDPELAWMEEINAAGGVLGKQVNYIVYDE
jgi:hypothetical protein